MSKKLTPKQDYYQEIHEAALTVRQAKAAEAAALQVTMAAKKAFCALVDPHCLLSAHQVTIALDKWADDPPQPSKETP